MNRSRTLLLCAMSLALFGQGCFGGGAEQATGPGGGVFKTGDRGQTWEQKRVLIQGAAGVSLAEDVIISMEVDPQDRNALYAGTLSRGLIYTLDGGNSWRVAHPNLPARIDSVAVDYKNKCVVYATSRNNIYKTENCNRDWERIFFDPNTEKTFTTITVDWFNPTVLYAGTSEGDVFKSTDAGLSWLVSARTGARVTDIVISPADSRHIYVATDGNGISRTLDGGSTWIAIRNQFAEFQNARRVTDLEFDAQEPNELYAVSRYGLLKSGDMGDTWADVSLISPPNEASIVDFEMNPRNGKEMQYITPNTLVVSSDGGATWTTTRLPSARIAATLHVDAEDGNILYIGMSAPPRQ